MKIIRPSNQDIPLEKSIFLAGPTIVDQDGKSLQELDWREEAIKIFRSFQYDGALFIPAPFIDSHDNILRNKYYQLCWENTALDLSTAIMFWVPRDLEKMPGFTTNVEFGLYIRSGKVAYGRPDDAPKTGVMDWHAVQQDIPIAETLCETVENVLKLL